MGNSYGKVFANFHKTIILTSNTYLLGSCRLSCTRSNVINILVCYFMFDLFQCFCNTLSFNPSLLVDKTLLSTFSNLFVISQRLKLERKITVLGFLLWVQFSFLFLYLTGLEHLCLGHY